MKEWEGWVVEVVVQLHNFIRARLESPCCFSWVVQGFICMLLTHAHQRTLRPRSLHLKIVVFIDILSFIHTPPPYALFYTSGSILTQTIILYISSFHMVTSIAQMNGNQKQLWQHIDANNTTPSTIITPTITTASRIKSSIDGVGGGGGGVVAGGGLEDERDPDVIPQYSK